LIGDFDMRLIITFAALAMLGLIACKPPEPSITVKDPNTGEDIKLSTKDKDGNKTITINSTEGKGTVSISGDGAPPTNMPAYLPNYPGAKYMASFTTDMAAVAQSGEGKGGMATFTTPDSQDKVLAFYKDALTKAGMKENATGDMGGMKMLSYSKADNAQEGAQIMASAAEGGATQVQVIYGVGQ
jgi:hypothetical protein